MTETNGHVTYTVKGRGPRIASRWIDPTRERLAWAAGLYEGEGTACAHKPAHSVIAGLTMTDRDRVELFSDIVGVGRVRGPMLRPGCKPIWRWNATSMEHVQALAAMLWPWLGPRRREQIRNALLNHHEHVRQNREKRLARKVAR